MKTTVLTVVWNRATQAKWGLNSLLKQDTPPDQLIVVDDGSKDGLKEVVDNLKDKYKNTEIDYIYLDHPEARIASFGRNIAIKKARHPIILSVESEVLHSSDSFVKLRDKIEKDGYLIPVCSQIWTMGPSIWQKFADKENDYLERPDTIFTHPYAFLTSGNMQNTKAPDSDWAITGSNNCFAGCFFGTLKENMLAVNGFDEEMDGYGWEDWDFINRVILYLTKEHPDKEKERANIFCNDIPIIHQWHRKDYPFNIYQKADENGNRSKERIEKSEYRANLNKKWGLGE